MDILLITEELATRELIEAHIEDGDRVLWTDDPDRTSSLLDEGDPCAIIIEHGDSVDGPSLVSRLRAASTLPLILLMEGADQVPEVLESGADMVHLEPWNPTAILTAIPALRERRDRIDHLEREARRYELLASNISDYLWMTDLDLNCTYFSPSIEKLSGISPERLLRMDMEEYIMPDSIPELRERMANIRESLAEGRDVGTISQELEVRFEDGILHWMEIRAQVGRDEKGRPWGLVGIAREITERKKMLESMENLNRTLKSFRNICQVIIHDGSEREMMTRVCDILVDVRGFETASIVIFQEDGAAWSVHSGREGHEMPSMVDWSQVHCIQLGAGSDGLVVMDPGDEGCQGCPVTRSVGCVKSIAMKLSFGKDAFGVLKVCLPEGNRWDQREMELITELANELGFALHIRRAEGLKSEMVIAQTTESRRFHDLFENMKMPCCIFGTREGGSFILLDINRAARKLEEMDRGEAIGNDILDIAPQLEDYGLVGSLRRVWRTGRPEQLPVRYYDGERWKGWRDDYVFMLDSGEIVTTYQDLSLLKRHQEQIALANKKLELLGKVTRHDIINQLSVIKGYEELAVEVAGGIDADPVLLKFLTRIGEATDVIIRQLDLTRDYEALGTREAIWIDVRELMEEAATEIDLGGVYFEVGVTGVEALLDPLVVKAFTNILENAVRHGMKTTRITVGFRETEEGAIISIEDDGVGVEEGMKESIFERGKGEHFGYGLYLVREMLDVTGASIRETGRKEEGARFEILLPPDKYRVRGR